MEMREVYGMAFYRRRNDFAIEEKTHLANVVTANKNLPQQVSVSVCFCVCLCVYVRMMCLCVCACMLVRRNDFAIEEKTWQT